jgi:hypothetical protein
MWWLNFPPGCSCLITSLLVSNTHGRNRSRVSGTQLIPLPLNLAMFVFDAVCKRGFYRVSIVKFKTVVR